MSNRNDNAPKGGYSYYVSDEQLAQFAKATIE